MLYTRTSFPEICVAIQIQLWCCVGGRDLLASTEPILKFNMNVEKLKTDVSSPVYQSGSRNIWAVCGIGSSLCVV